MRRSCFVVCIRVRNGVAVSEMKIVPKMKELELAIERFNSIIPLPDPRETSFNHADLMEYRNQIIKQFVNTIIEAFRSKNIS